MLRPSRPDRRPAFGRLAYTAFLFAIAFFWVFLARLALSA